MQHIIRPEAITKAPKGTRVPLERLCRELADRVEAPVASATGTPAAIDEDLLSRLLLVQLDSAGLFSGPAAGPPLSGGPRRWLDESVRQLRERGLLRGAPAQPVPVGPASARDVWAEWRERGSAWRRDAGLRAQTALLDATLRALPDILRGDVLATDVMFPRSSTELVEPVYRDNPVSDCFNAILAEAAAGVVGEIVSADPAARVRVLEIGAGTGGGSVKVFERLEPFAAHVETYSYTDLSKSFLMRAEQEYGPHHPYLDYRIFDVEEPLAAQDVVPGSYDLVLATNVLHATRRIRTTLRNAKAALKRHGVLIANELSAPSLFTHLTFGLLDGWWLYEDDELRIPGCPGLTPDSWREALDDEGFGSVSFPARRLHDLGHQVIVAESDGVVRQETAAPAPVDRPERRPTRSPKAAPSAPDQALEQHVRGAIFEQLQSSLKVDRTQIAADDAFMDYGIDSIIGVQLIQEINREIGTDLTTTDLFDHGSVSRLTRHIMDAYRDRIAEALPQAQRVAPEEPAPPSTASRPAAPQGRGNAPGRARTPADTRSREPIAVIGMSGRFAGSDDVEQLWEHLVRGHDLVEPVSRWDLTRYRREGAGHCEHGSFIEGIDRFDPTFFNISGVEATYMDPQQRLFLEESWKALEDAGYAGSGTQGRRVGVYVGCQESGYAQLFREEAPPQAMWGNALSAMPARISYHLDLQGPAIAVDTACSSSLVVIHLACQGLWNGETEMALAGGVSVQCTPQFYVMAGQAGMLSAAGRCHAFDDRADGFVPGEGVGVVALKRLSDALADGDHIHGVISGSGINQDGASNGITAPSAASQERLETSVYDTFGINPEHVQMMEAHGTGTKLGDPIEYHALKRSFRRYTRRRDYCALGSVKSNLGHTITAAGVAGVIKVLLSLRHRRIPPSINFEKANAHIDTADSPFYVNTADRPWEAGEDGARRGAVSSFGVSGTNAHVVIEEAPRPAPRADARSAYLLTLSAGTAEQLGEQVERLLRHCERRPELDPGDIALTLLLGRKHLAHRLACVVHDHAETVRTLRAWLDLGESSRVSVGEVPAQGLDERAALRDLGNDRIRRAAATTDPVSRAELLATVADLYVQGYGLDYAALFADDNRTRVPLPTYPFARDRYWVPESQQPAPARPGADEGHPLLHGEASDFSVRRYRTRFTGDEPLLTDHVVKGKKVLPGVACLEMARAAAALTLGKDDTGDPGITLRNVVWARPVTAGDEPVDLVTSLRPMGRSEADFEITGAGDDARGAAPAVHSQGRVVRRTATPAQLSLPELQAGCERAVLTADQLYPAYASLGFRYGPSHRGLERIHIGRDQILARLVLPDAVRSTRDAFVLHPSLLDATLQASLGMGAAAGTAKDLDVTGMRPSLPFAMDELEALGPCAESMWAWIRYSPGSPADGSVFKLDIDLCDDRGQVRVRIRGMSYRVLEAEVAQETPIAVSAVSFLPVWRETEPGDAEPEPRKRVVLLPDMPALGEALVRRDPASPPLHLHCTAPGIAERFAAYTAQALAHVQGLLADGAREQVLVQLVVPDEAGPALTQGVLGLLRSAQAEEPRLLAQAVLVDPHQGVERSADQLGEARRYPGTTFLRFRRDRVEALAWRENTAQPETRVPWRNGGVYLLTGGLGGLGTLVARDMAAKADGVTLVLAGRSPLSAEQEDVLDALRAQGAEARYERVDVADGPAVRSLVEGILREEGALHGIVHAAGILRDGLVRNKTEQQCHEVLAPKVAGMVNLDEASRGVPLDFLVAFSGAAGVFGNTGQADYAAANAFLDAYAHHRRRLAAEGERSGATVSVDWPLWAEGGMRVDPGTEETMRERLGMAPMPTPLGIGALYAALDAPHTQALVLAGDADRIRSTLLGRSTVPEPSPTASRPDVPAGRTADPRPRDATAAGGDALRTALVDHLRDTLAGVIQIPAHRIEPGAPFERFGIDSVLAITVTNRLEEDFGSLSKTLLFEHQSIDRLSDYFLESHPDALERILGVRAETVPPAPVQEPPRASAETVPSTPVSTRTPSKPTGPATDDAIAVVGLSGRYPGAKDLDEFWENLVVGRDGVTEVPRDRWDHDLYHGSERSEPGRTPARWGGFLDGVADFDALFFNVSPREAAIMDPQTRLFLECVWNLLESSGYTRDRLRDAHGGSVGVYVGAMYQHYQLLASDIVHESITSVTGPSAIANRVSHFFDLQGPSLAVDTTCSSSLVAIHMACEELRRGTSEMMIAGGVNLTLHPKKYLGLSLTGLAGSGPDSRAFLDGDGFIPAEGVGAVLLKPLSKAVRDRDEVLAVIRSSATNHKGRTNGPMVPNLDQQARLIEENLERAGVHPRTVSYVEASANGSQIGDALEFAALRKTFGERTRDERFCAVGTVKSTLGNLEAASGVAQLSKVVLQMGNRRITPFTGRGRLNPGVEFEGTAFYLPREAEQWDPPVVNLDGRERAYPRRATISAFGAGGTNAHLVVEEYVSGDSVEPTAADPGPQVVLLSAPTEERLRAVADRLREFVGTREELSLVDLAYTLQRGREAMDFRLALVAGSHRELVTGLTHYLDGSATSAPVPLFTGDARRQDSDLGTLLSGGVGEAVVRELLTENRPEKLALLWARGGSVPWESLSRGGVSPRMLRSLPTYPFDRRRYWVSSPAGRGSVDATPPVTGPESLPDAAPPTVAADPADATEGRITALVAASLGVRVDELDPTAPLEDLGFSSILAPSLLKALQTEIDPKADLAALAECRSTEDLLRRFGTGDPFETGRRTADPEYVPEAVRLNAGREGRPVFWFHGGLGGVEAYAPIADSVERPFYGIQARGWMTNSDPLHGVAALAEHYTRIIRRVQPEGPYDLGGYSFGGLLAYEVTRRLQDEGAVVETIVMVDAMYGDSIKKMTMSRTDMALQQVNALLSAAVKPSPREFATAFVTAGEVDWAQDEGDLLDQLIELARARGLRGEARALRARVEQNLRVQEAYGVTDYELRPLPRPASVTCFYFRNSSGLFYGEMEPLFSARENGGLLDHVDYWGEWQRQLPNFHRTDVEAANHFVLLSDPEPLTAIRSFCALLYAGGRGKRVPVAKAWVTRRRTARGEQ
ncbi:SDR family NAD(P)-dependent oxidoreductase [Nocardiopsis akebiae]|uniref:SDR family NAD(P)-dependent oxidoreductase n=1 Tax=Nocardiopsis akebiae TaxID=2831968 RepID=A0ABX8BXZ8_9ACTN|nr:SDR family NAD(P)-dependent oxidoreductase [Nocardiopsis akebiae]QUX26966.1 SDR family NAD(P)-dependent oxidoreductase [Nocardiopsis akebiae]